MDDLVKNILTSKVYEAAVETPLDFASRMTERLNCDVYLKREDLQPVFSFKLRGAYNKIAHLSSKELSQGIIAASAGNHAQGVAFSAQKLGAKALIVMPETTPEIKVSAVRKLGAKVELYGESYSAAAERCQELSKSTGMTFIHPFNDPLVIAGQGTIGDELLRQTAGKLDAVFLPIGGGGLISGVAAFLKNLIPEVLVVGVEPTDSDAMAQSLEKGERTKLDTVGIFADGVAVREVGDLTFALCQKYVDKIIRVDTDEICGAIKSIYHATRSIVEPSGALAVAGLKKYARQQKWSGKTLVAVNSGANMNFERLSYVAERTLLGEQQEALFAVTIPEKAGSLKRFCADVLGERNLTEFNYRLASRDKAHIFVGISMTGYEEREIFSQVLDRNGFENLDLTDNELAKTHIRYMVGGRSQAANREHLFRFWFPERPGALTRFLYSMSESWNISLFHYRTQGGEYGRVLIGLEIPDGEEDKLQEFLDQLGYHYIRETDNPAYSLFL